MRKHLFIFLLASFILTLLVYRSALWGDALLAPLDQGTTFFEHFAYADSAAGKVPENHHISDQFVYDLPLQSAIHRAYREGEIPWWDPWTYGGRPLLADAHVNGTDLIRVLCYALLPFELAYNWNIALRGIITGLGMFLLLRHLRVEMVVSIILSLSYQFAGWFTLYFGHPWIQGSFAYFPFLWIVWIASLKRETGYLDGLGAILVGLVFAAGNLQSHAYLPLFALAFLMGIALCDRQRLLRAFVVVAISGLLGAMLSFPMLGNQIEFFIHSNRAIVPESSHWMTRLLALVFSMASIHPWAAGTFRTLELGKLFGLGGIAFLLFYGGAGAVIASAGLRKVLSSTTDSRAAAVTSLACLATYLLVIASPLNKLFYPRMAGMAGMGLVVLAGLACREWAIRGPLLSQRWARRLAIVHLIIVVTSSGIVIAGYPLAKDKIASIVFAAGVKNSGGMGTVELRRAQIERLPKESTLLNPEALVGLVATLTAILATRHSLSKTSGRNGCYAALGFGLLACVSFHHRFRPLHDVAIWEKLKLGGQAQQAAIALTRGGERIDESKLPLENQVFPLAWAAHYRIHAVQGYSALQPKSLNNYPSNLVPPADRWKADFVGDGKGNFVPTSGNGSSRFRSLQGSDQLPLEVTAETHNQLTLTYLGEPPISGFIQTDTHYPGWHCPPSGAKPATNEYSFSLWKIPLACGQTRILAYQPTLRRFWKAAFASALLAIVVLAMRSIAMSRRLARVAPDGQQHQ